MAMTVYETVYQFAKQKAPGSHVNVIHLLYGYAQVLGMNRSILEKLFPESTERDILRSLEKEAEDERLDITLIRQGLPLLISARLKEEIDLSVPESVGDKDAVALFKGVLKKNPSLLENIQEGHTVNDILRLLKEWQDETEKKEGPRTGEKAKAEKASPAKEEAKAEEASPVKEKSGTPSTSEPSEKSKTEKDLKSLAKEAKILFSQLKEVVIGQDEAIEIFVRGYFKAQLFSGLSNTKKAPRAVFLFAGPPGTGKTLLATKAAELLKKPCLTLNMSEYSDNLSPNKLTGNEEVYRGASEGILTGFVKAHPDSVVILDEIEKAHLNAIHLFLQVLDRGELQDSHKRTAVSFKDTILIFTTNVGKKLYEDGQDKNLSLLDASVVLDAIEKEEHPERGTPLFPAAICSRFTAGNVVMFNHLSARHLLTIADMQFKACQKLLEHVYDYRISLDENLSRFFLLHQGYPLDARVVSAKSGQFLQDELYEFARQADEKADLARVRAIDFRVRLDGADDEIKSLFASPDAFSVLAFGGKAPEDALYIDVAFEGKNVNLFRTDSIDEMDALLVKNDIGFVVIDPEYGPIVEEKKALSLDDRWTKGIRAFHHLVQSLPETKVYLFEREEGIPDADKAVLTREGARGFIKAKGGDAAAVGRAIAALAMYAYAERRLMEVSGRGKRLDYNTVQTIDEEGSRARIEFYDFRLHTAVNADDQGLILDRSETPDVTFADVIGSKGAKEELAYFVRFLKSPKEFLLKGVRPPRGILLYGPPGTGKTMLAKAMAGEADAAFFAVNATDFMDKYVGEGEGKIRTLFQTARKYAPSIIFIDEIDAIAKERTGESHVETYLNTLMTEMDGFKFDPQRPVFVLAATNFPIKRESGSGAVIDPALLRRFDNKLEVDLPTREERREFLHRLAEKSQAAGLSEAALDNIAARTTGESLANLQNIVNLAVRKALREGKALSDDDLLRAMEEFYYGEEKTWGKDYYESVAHHESGHAYISHLSGQTPSFVTIVSRGDFGGYMQHDSQEDIPSYTKEALLWRIRTALAGRAAEIVFYGEDAGVNTGVSGDLKNATNLAIQMICRYGMADHTLLSLDFEKILGSPYGENVLQEAEAILERELKTTIGFITEGKDKVEALSQKLLEKNQLMKDEIAEVLEEYRT